mmetsp:Transcript_67664/g.151984  ORF Transcript_67664/g.151984 Transcript_67664/m.151984 type:complete len:976 (-) Transcript_67664:277-3204(-)
MLEEASNSGEGYCDSSTAEKLLVNLTRISQLSKAHKVIDGCVANKVYLDVSGIVSIATAVSQRSQSHRALRYLRRLIYECLPPDFGAEQVQFFDRHASFIFSELMAEADGCFGRMENRDPNTLVNLGHTELGIEMDWGKSSATSYVLYNRADDKGKKVYQPTVFQGGFQRTDSALMSFDISYPEVAAQVRLDYDRIRDGAEVEVTGSATAPNQTAALQVRLTSPPKVAFKPGMAYRLDRLASRDQTRRMLEALKTVLKKPGGEENHDGQMSSLQPASELRELILVPMDTTLSKANKAHLPTTTMDFGKDRARQNGLAAFQEESKERYGPLLNKSQLEALDRACSQRITLIQGPPGTGKTTTAVQIVSALVQYGLVDLPMLVTADSNTAVDNLVKGIGKKGLAVVRVGRPESIREDVKQYALDGRWKELKKAEVVCATCIGASGSTVDKLRFNTVLIDECTQAAESAALVPIARGCQQCILIGDQCQLPPTVLSDVAETENLGESLFTRLVTQGVRPVLLDTQYRMHPLIAEFASAAFYNGRLQNGVSHIHRKPPEGFPWPQRQMPVAFVNLEKGEEKREGSSYINPAEAEKTLWALLEVCKNEILGPEDVGLVTPYKGQVNFIKKLIRERPGLQKFRTGLEVESVDGFQGQEKEVIIFCAVRNNREGKVGFLSDWRRLNVMLTRARRGCIVIGSRSTLVSDPLWQQWLLWATARGAICGESAKGTWVPKYLVDDRDGVWTVKASLIDEAKGGAPVAGGPAINSISKKEDSKEAEAVLDSWEDLGSPLVSPTAEMASPEKIAGGLLEEVAELLENGGEGATASAPSTGPRAPKDGDAAPELMTRAEEERAARGLGRRTHLVDEEEEEDFRTAFKKDPNAPKFAQPTPAAGDGEDGDCDREDAEEADAKEPAGEPAESGAAPARRKLSHIDAEAAGSGDDEVRCTGTPNAGPKSPSRQLAMAKLGLVDDLDLEEPPR